ncbi:MAG: PTS sugar transporter subunit IIC [Gemmatimonadetes bacterium]|nr:PTS sugar transporter subunit IIC [Gemmatimonadota bacterium]
MSPWVLFLAGGIVGLDATSLPQIMISRPIVAGALMGWLLGIPVEGAAIGAIYELFHLGILPIGAARYPEPGTAMLAAVWAYAASHASPGSGFLMAIAFALVWERVTGASVVLLRRWNGIVLMRGNPPPTPGAVQARHGAAIAGDFVRGGITALAGGFIGAAVIGALEPFWPFDPGFAAGVLSLASLACAAGALSIFGGWRERWRYVLAGVGAGVLLLVVT